MFEHSDDAHRKQRRWCQGQGEHEALPCTHAAFTTEIAGGIGGFFRFGIFRTAVFCSSVFRSNVFCSSVFCSSIFCSSIFCLGIFRFGVRDNNFAELAVQGVEVKDTENIVHFLWLDIQLSREGGTEIFDRLADADAGEENYREQQRDISANARFRRSGGRKIFLHKHLDDE